MQILFGDGRPAEPEVKTDALMQTILDTIKPAQALPAPDAAGQELLRLYEEAQALPPQPGGDALMQALSGGGKDGPETAAESNAFIQGFQDDGRKNDTTKDIEKVKIEGYNKIVIELADVDATAIYEAAKKGGQHKGIFRDAMKKRRPALQKSIASHVEQVKEHADKIRHPDKYDSGWLEKDRRQREGLLKKWKKDLNRNAEQAEIEIETWKERFGDDN